MSTTRRTRQCARRIATLIRQSTLIAAAALLAGCYRYTDVSDFRTIGESTISTRDGAEFEFRSATIGLDSVTGQLGDGRLAFPRADVVRIRERKLSVPLTVFGTIGFALLVLPFVAQASCAEDDNC